MTFQRLSSKSFGYYIGYCNGLDKSVWSGKNLDLGYKPVKGYLFRQWVPKNKHYDGDVLQKRYDGNLRHRPCDNDGRREHYDGNFRHQHCYNSFRHQHYDGDFRRKHHDIVHAYDVRRKSYDSNVRRQLHNNGFERRCYDSGIRHRPRDDYGYRNVQNHFRDDDVPNRLYDDCDQYQCSDEIAENGKHSSRIRRSDALSTNTEQTLQTPHKQQSVQTFSNERCSRSSTKQTSQTTLRSTCRSQQHYKRQQQQFGEHLVKTMLPHKGFATPTTTASTDEEFTTRVSVQPNGNTHSDNPTTETSTDNHSRSKLLEQVPTSVPKATPISTTHSDGVRRRQIHSEFSQHSDPLHAGSQIHTFGPNDFQQHSRDGIIDSDKCRRHNKFFQARAAQRLQQLLTEISDKHSQNNRQDPTHDVSKQLRQRRAQPTSEDHKQSSEPPQLQTQQQQKQQQQQQQPQHQCLPIDLHSDYHCCHYDYASDYPTVNGFRTVLFQITPNAHVLFPFFVSGVPTTTLSLRRLRRVAGFEVHDGDVYFRGQSLRRSADLPKLQLAVLRKIPYSEARTMVTVPTHTGVSTSTSTAVRDDHKTTDSEHPQQRQHSQQHNDTDVQQPSSDTTFQPQYRWFPPWHSAWNATMPKVLLGHRLFKWSAWCNSKDQFLLDLARLPPWILGPILHKLGIPKQQLLQEIYECEPWTIQLFHKHIQNNLRRHSPSYRSSKLANYCGM